MLAPLLSVGCGGKTADENAQQVQAGGSVSTGGASSVNTGIVGCSGLPVAKPAPLNAGHSGDCSGSQGLGQQVVGGLSVNVLETFLTSSRCTYLAPACTPLIAFTSSAGYLDPNNLSVWFSFPDGSAEMYPGVVSAADCTTSLGGFYLDNINTMPTTITFCPCTCARLGSIQGTVYVVDFPVIVIN